MASMLLLDKQGRRVGDALSCITGAPSEMTLPAGYILSWSNVFSLPEGEVLKMSLLHLGKARIWVEGESRIPVVRIESTDPQDMTSAIEHVIGLVGGNVQTVVPSSPTDDSFTRGVGNDLRRLWAYLVTKCRGLRRLDFRLTK